MYPPSWALTGSTRLDLDQFATEFSSAWSRIQSRFLKLECWQQYQEAETNESQAAYNRGDVETARELLRYELLSYRIREQMGENIEVVHCDPARRLPNDECFDFLLFDRHTVLIHDYGAGEVGRQTGGWVTHDPAAIARLDATVTSLRMKAEPLERYVARS